MSVMLDVDRHARFDERQYREAIENLSDGHKQLEPDGRGCVICGGSGHQAWECGHNPLHAMALCQEVARRANRMHDRMHEITQNHVVDESFQDDMHEFLHWCIGVYGQMGHMIGPRVIVLPDPEPRTP